MVLFRYWHCVHGSFYYAGPESGMYVSFGIITRIANQGPQLGRRVVVSDVYLQYSTEYLIFYLQVFPIDISYSEQVNIFVHYPWDQNSHVTHTILYSMQSTECTYFCRNQYRAIVGNNTLAYSLPAHPNRDPPLNPVGPSRSLPLVFFSSSSLLLLFSFFFLFSSSAFSLPSVSRSSLSSSLVVVLLVL